MTAPRLDAIRNCLEGVVPSFLATCDAEGVPNISEISQVEFVDAGHVALSYQFFNKTRRNVLETRKASVVVTDPDTNARYRLALGFEETQTSGPVFEAMRAKLAGIASHSGMTGVFRLLGSDIYNVRSIKQLESKLLPARSTESPLSATRRVAAELNGAADLGELFDRALEALERHLDIRHAMVLMVDTAKEVFFTVASRGYPTTGIGSEICPGHGVIGVAASEGVPIRIGHMAAEYSYSTAVRANAGANGTELSSGIPYPGLEAPLSQIALPIRPRGETIGVLFAESQEANAFGYEKEDALTLIAAELGLRILLSQHDDRAAPVAPAATMSATVRVRHYLADHTIFFGDDYLIKGVAGAILWKLLREHEQTGRTEFTNRELRLDPALRLPEFIDNLEARLLLLQRRLAERSACIQISKSGRGRFRLQLSAALDLEEV